LGFGAWDFSQIMRGKARRQAIAGLDVRDVVNIGQALYKSGSCWGASAIVEVIMIRKRLMDAQKEAMREREAKRLSTLRLVNAAIKDKDIAARSEEGADGVSDAEIMGILAKMIKQRQDSSKIFEEAGRLELAEGERVEIKVIEEFLPKQLSEAEVEAAIAAAVAEVGASSIRDMGKIMGVLKSKYTGQMDFGKVGAAVKAALA